MQINYANAEKAKRLYNKERIEQEVSGQPHYWPSCWTVFHLSSLSIWKKFWRARPRTVMRACKLTHMGRAQVAPAAWANRRCARSPQKWRIHAAVRVSKIIHKLTLFQQIISVFIFLSLKVGLKFSKWVQAGRVPRSLLRPNSAPRGSWELAHSACTGTKMQLI